MKKQTISVEYVFSSSTFGKMNISSYILTLINLIPEFYKNSVFHA